MVEIQLYYHENGRSRKKKQAQQPGGGIPLQNQSLRWNVLPRLPGPDPVYDMDF